MVRQHLAHLWWRLLLTFPDLRRDLADAYTMRSFEDLTDDVADMLTSCAVAAHNAMGEADTIVAHNTMDETDGIEAAAQSSNGLSKKEETSRRGPPHVPPLDACQPGLPRVPMDAATGARVSWYRYDGDTHQGDAAEATRRALKSLYPTMDFTQEWAPLLSRAKAKKYVAVSRKHLRNLKRSRPRNGDIGASDDTLTRAPSSSHDDTAHDAHDEDGEEERPTKKSRSGTRNRKLERERMVAAQQPDSGALQIALDLGMGDSMSKKELNKLANQIRRL